MPAQVSSGSKAGSVNRDAYPMGGGLDVGKKTLTFTGEGTRISNPEAACNTAREVYKTVSPYGHGKKSGGISL